MLKKKLQEELKQAMLSRDVLKTSVLRLLLSAINYYEIQKGGAGYEATDEDVLSVIQKEAKQRRDSIEEFKKANRSELAEKESKELEMLKVYLPQQMSEDQIREIVKETIREMGATTVAEMGKVMGSLMPKVKGKADGGIVSKIVKESLNS
ncbi:MAG: GatB/YqeY domain-containing protein [Candidatus Levybacteria bacterium]|nr:GatB/YqeY domain-containing protein [Candidatus Levybacteria bacterium]